MVKVGVTYGEEIVRTTRPEGEGRRLSGMLERLKYATLCLLSAPIAVFGSVVCAVVVLLGKGWITTDQRSD